MTISAGLDHGRLTVVVEGRFDFSAHKEFRDTYENLSERPEKFLIDMGKTDYIDRCRLRFRILPSASPRRSER